MGAASIANAERRAELRARTDEQAALRRIATLVARGVEPQEIFSAVTQEMGRLFESEAAIARFDHDGPAIVTVAMTPGISILSVGTRRPLEDFLASTAVYRTGRPARKDHSGLQDTPGPVAEALRKMGFVSTVAAPIVVQGSLWGVITISHLHESLPPGTEERVEKFTELLGTAIANVESRAELAASEARARHLAGEQAALRRVATLVAKREEAEEVFSAVAEEVARTFGVQMVTICRYEPDAILVLSSSGIPAFPAGSRWPFDVVSLPATIHESGSSERIDDFANASGLDDLAAEAGVTGAVGAPILVDGRVWGCINIATTASTVLPDDVEQRLARFTDLVATSVWNATMRAELDASRARIVATTDATRRRIERDLHDGAQQRLVSLALELRAAQEDVPPELRKLRDELSTIAEGLTGVLDGLREIALGIHPALLAEGGLGPALRTLARRSAVPVELAVRVDGRLPEHVEVAAYYVVSEALTNAAKYAQASLVCVDVETEDGVLRVSVRDDGVGGADPALGSGLLGLKDRAEAIGGQISLESPADRGTTLQVELPLAAVGG